MALEGLKLIAARGPGPAGRPEARVSARPDPDGRRAGRHGPVPGPLRRVRARTAWSGPPRCSATRRTSAWIHSERLGFERDWYAERGLAWVVRAAELAILEPLPLGQVVDVSTAVTGFRRVWARRRTEGRLAGRAARALGPHRLGHDRLVRGLPGRVPPEFPARVRGAAGPLRAGPRPAAVHPGRRRPPRVARPPPGPGPDGPRQQRRVPGLPRGGAGVRGDAAPTGDHAACPAGSGSSTSVPAAPVPGSSATTWPGAVDGSSVLGVAPGRRRRARAGPRTGAPAQAA